MLGHVRMERSIGKQSINPGGNAAVLARVTQNFSLAALALLAAMLTPIAFCEESTVSLLDQLRGEAPQAVSGNPAAESIVPGNAWLIGLIPGRPLGEIGLRLGGVWLADTNGLISGGAQPGKWSWNSALIVGADLDAEKLVGWTGASFGIQFLQFNGEDTNSQAGSVQGYNSLPGPPPLDRSELYQSGTGRAFLMTGSSFASARWCQPLILTTSPVPCPPKTSG